MAVPPRPGLRERKKQRTRNALEEVALGLFAERGYEGTSVAAIADAADVSTRTFFRYFATKADVLFADHPRRVAALTEALRAQPDLTIDSATDTVVSFFVDDLTNSAERFRIKLATAAEHAPTRALLYQHQADLIDVIAAELKRRDLARTVEAQMIASATIAAVREMSLPCLVEGRPDLVAQLQEARQRIHGLRSLVA